MTVNRIEHLLERDPGDPRYHDAVKLVAEMLDGIGGDKADRWIAAHPGEQCYLLVLDCAEPVVEGIMECSGMVLPEVLPGEGELFVGAVARQSGVEVARQLAVDESRTQAICDQLVTSALVVIYLVCGVMGIAGCTRWGSAADIERERRQQRRRRSGT